MSSTPINTTTPTMEFTSPTEMLLNTPSPTVALSLPVDVTATISSPFLTDTSVFQDAATQTVVSAVEDLRILSYKDAEEIFQTMKVPAEARPDSPPYQPAPTPTWSEDEWPLGSPLNSDNLYEARYTPHTVSHLPHPAIVNKDIELIESWREFAYALLTQEKPLEEAKKKATHLVLHPYKSFDTCKCCNLTSPRPSPTYITLDETVAPALHTFDQISPGYFIDVLTETHCSPDHIMPNWDEYDLVRGKKGKCHFAEPVTGHFPLLSDDKLLDVLHHCITTLEAFQTHLGCILNQRQWEIKSIANCLINADAEEHILPLITTPYPIPVDSEPPPLPADVISSPFVAMTPLALSPHPLPSPNPATSQYPCSYILLTPPQE